MADRAVIVISDLRDVPVAAALSIRSMLHGMKVSVVVSERTLNLCDFGQWQHPTRTLRSHVITKLFNVEIIPAEQEHDCLPQDTGHAGLKSSLFSLTSDSDATPQRYPHLWAKLCQLKSGALEICNYIERERPVRVYIFNGRLASTFDIARYLFDRGISTYFYEYSARPDRFTLTPFSVHNMPAWGRTLLAAYQSASRKELDEISVDSIKAAKLNNTFTAAYIRNSGESFDVVIFLSSTHEYAAVDYSITGVSVQSEECFVQRVIDRNGRNKQYAIRCHPNQAKDKNWRASLRGLIKLAEDRNITFYEPECGISSHDLIKRSKLVAVDISSIGIDATFLSKPVQFYGNPEYRPVYEHLATVFEQGSEKFANEFARALSFRSSAFTYPFSRKMRLFLRLDRAMQTVYAGLICFRNAAGRKLRFRTRVKEFIYR